MIRFLLYTNEFDVEGLVASSATFANIADKQNILDILYLYDRIDNHLQKHDSDYPIAEQLRSVTCSKWRKKVQEDFAKRADWMLP